MSKISNYEHVCVILRDVVSELNEIVERHDDLTEIEKNAFCEKYPFDESFDEIVAKLNEFAEHQNAICDKLYPNNK